MAEYKTYICDICGKQGATHLEIPDVDYVTDPATGRREGINGHVDICCDHMKQFVEVFFDEVETSIMHRRAIWKKLLN